MNVPEVPVWVDCVVLIVCVSVLALTWRGISETARRLYAPDRAWRISCWVAAVLISWFLAAVFLTTIAPLPNTSLLNVLAILGWVGGLVAVGYGLRFTSATGRAVARAVPQSWLVGIQCYRVVGVIFLVLMAGRVLPPHFAYPAGVGDLVVGLPALPVAYFYARHPGRATVAAWAVNLLGFLDFVVALGIGTNLLQGPAEAIFGGSSGTTSVLPFFPLGLIPTVLIPLGFVVHLHSITNLWSPPSGGPVTFKPTGLPGR